MEKYKHGTAEGWYIYFDENGKEYPAFTQKNRPGMYADMEKWKAIPGNEIEPRETTEEIASREAKEAEQALENQKIELRNLIKNNEYHLSHKPDSGRRFAAEWEVWDKLIKTWEAQYEVVKSGKMVEIVEKPFNNT